MKRFPTAATLAISLTGAVSAAPDEEPEHAHARLIADQVTLAPGSTFTLGLHIEIDDGWHLYWDGFNDSGFPIQLELELPEGFVAEPMLWPTPERYISGDGEILDHIYEDEVTLLIPIRVPETISTGETVEIKGVADWLVCKEMCIPGGDESLSIEFPVTGAQHDNPGVEMIEKARQKVPKPIATDPRVRADFRNGKLEVLAPGASTIAFYPASDSAEPVNAMKEGETKGAQLQMQFKPGENPVKGVIDAVWTSTTGFERRSFWIELPAG